MRVAVHPFAEDLTSSRTTQRLVEAESRATSQPSDPRLAVILAADMVGYSRHMAEDEAGTHAHCMALRLQIIEPAAAKNGARIFKYTGDGFMAEFVSATRAVWFAVTFQDAVRVWNARRAGNRRFKFRVGINLGDVIVEPHDVFGHSVNIAARLEAIARPGGVLVSQAVVASVRDPRIRFEEAGDLSLKNIDEPVRGFRAALSAQARRRRARSRDLTGAAQQQWRGANSSDGAG
jgi:class 3 adenylate cyclase